MLVSGFTIVRNAIKYDYPIVESIQSILPLVDEFIVSVGNSEDGTLGLIQSINSPKIKIIESIWDDSLREGGLVLSHETNIAMDAISKKSVWAFYLQADEVIHENYLESIKEALTKYKYDQKVEGLLFDYTHFYGDYKHVGDSRQWYRNEIRIVRNDHNIRSYKDAQGFRKNGNKLKVKKINASVYHYGWVKPPKAQQLKQESFHKMWHDDQWMKTNIAQTEEFDYSQINSLKPFSETHPSPMLTRVSKASWTFNYDPDKLKLTLKDKLLLMIEKTIGWRVGEYKNYTRIN